MSGTRHYRGRGGLAGGRDCDNETAAVVTAMSPSSSLPCSRWCLVAARSPDVLPDVLPMLDHAQVANVITMPANDKLPLGEASRCDRQRDDCLGSGLNCRILHSCLWDRGDEVPPRSATYQAA